ncbi:MAG: polysaccharide deacetylase family protein, partial [Usitatibacter sp.]
MSAPARVPVLTWHAMNVAGPGYDTNEHVAFRDDLEAIHRLGLRVVPAIEIARALVEGRLQEMRGCVGLTFDDGSDFDFHDLPHPSQGPQRGMAGILRDFRARHGAGAQPQLHATSFAIVSPAAREELDRSCMIGCRWWNDGWWPRAEAEGLLAVESHGWDHNHDSLAHTAASAPKGAFDLRTVQDADAEIAQASRVLRRLRGREGEVLFAYPYGVPNHYLAGDYLPNRMAHHGVYAAFSTDPVPVSAASSRW